MMLGPNTARLSTGKTGEQAKCPANLQSGTSTGRCGIARHPPTLVKGRRHQCTANLLETSNPKLSS